jgi:L-alanine-DL-glutamate epimerase-like enolase superfamily enzyme
MTLKLSVHGETWPAIVPFRITGKTFTSFESIVIELSRGNMKGRGEALGVYYFDETQSRMLEQVEAMRPRIEQGIDRAELQDLLPPGGVRNAIDCALWDLEAKSKGQSIWSLTGVVPKALHTVFTIGMEDTPAQMAAKAAAAANTGLLKIKLNDDRPLARLQAIRAARPDARLVVDANQGWNIDLLNEVLEAANALRLEMIEQPLPRGADGALEGMQPAVPLCADESCLHLGELDAVANRYQMINIKLDKTGGLTHALQLASEARRRGLRLMVGSMAGSSLAMAPTFVVGCLADLVDIDGPLLQKSDHPQGIRYDGGRADVFGPELWG